MLRPHGLPSGGRFRRCGRAQRAAADRRPVDRGAAALCRHRARARRPGALVRRALFHHLASRLAAAAELRDPAAAAKLMALDVVTLRERPDLRAAIFADETQGSLWPEFMRHDPVAALYF